VARFDTGLLSPSDWKGQWIGSDGLLRREFTLPEEPRRARAYIAGLGYYELHLNGRRVGNHVLDPGWTNYKKRILYATYDVTRLLRKGKNAIGVMLGQGWYKSRALMFELYIEDASGNVTEIHSDTSWQTARGPVLEDSIYHGETYDARLELPGWNRPDFAAPTSWHQASVVAETPTGVLSSQMMPAIQVIETIVPLTMTNPAPGVYVFDSVRTSARPASG